MKLEEAIKHLEEMLCRSRSCGCIKCSQEHKDLLDFLKELEKYQEIGKWIPTMKMMPPKDLDVVGVYHVRIMFNDHSFNPDIKHYKQVMHWDGFVWVDNAGHRLALQSVSHWCCIPDL